MAEHSLKNVSKRKIAVIDIPWSELVEDLDFDFCVASYRRDDIAELEVTLAEMVENKLRVIKK